MRRHVNAALTTALFVVSLYAGDYLRRLIKKGNK